jgi:putative ABC transport system permease protein
MRQLLLIAFRNLMQHTRRTLLLGAAIGGVTALLVLLTALSAGIRQTMLESATTLMTGHVNIGGFYKITSGQSAPVVIQYRKLLDILKDYPEIDYITARSRGWAKLVSDTSSVFSGVSGVDIANEPGMRRVLHIESGSLDDLAKPNTILIFEEQAKRLDVKVGDAMTISAQTLRGSNNTVDVTVAAIATDMGLFSSFQTYVPNKTLLDVYHISSDNTGALQIYLKDMTKIPDFEAKLRTRLSDAGYRLMDANPTAFFMKFQSVNREDWTGQKLDVDSWEDEVSFMSWILSSLSWLTAVLIAVLLGIIVIGIMNTMWIVIRERTREIGTLRAIGMQRRGVLAMMMFEALQLGLGATVGGVLIASLVAGGLNAAAIKIPRAVQVFLMRDHLWLWVTPFWIVTSIVLITALTGLAALYPSFRAARLRPVTAMHHVG